MGNFSLQFCTDTLLEGAATEGFAVAMADHPVAAPYRGLDAMPDAAHKVKAAIRTLRAQAADLPLNGRIVTLGFSRGSGMALLAATTRGRRELEHGGAHPSVASDVQGAVVLSGRFTYLELRADDAMIPRYTAAWGARATHETIWRTHGALDYLATPTVPLFLSINETESPDALHQMEVLRNRLTRLGSPFRYHPEREARGHRMPLSPEVLQPLLSFLSSQLNVAAPGQAASNPTSP
jgi:acetyl esterase/lipase